MLKCITQPTVFFLVDGLTLPGVKDRDMVQELQRIFPTSCTFSLFWGLVQLPFPPLTKLAIGYHKNEKHMKLHPEALTTTSSYFKQ